MAGASSQALVLERFLEAKGFARKQGALLAGSGAQLQRASDLSPAFQRRDARPLGLSQLDRLLAGGLPKGGVVELVGRRSSGRLSVALVALASTTSAGEPAAFIDLGSHFDPQAAAAAGVDLERVLWVRPDRVKAALAAAEMLLATGFPLVITDLGLNPRGARHMPDAAWVRLARSAQSQGASLLLLSPYRVSGIAADTVLSASAARPLWQGTGNSPRLLAGICASVTLEKSGRSTPARGIALSLRMPGALLPDTDQKSPVANRAFPPARAPRSPEFAIRNSGF